MRLLSARDGDHDLDLESSVDPTGEYALFGILLGLSWILLFLRLYVRIFVLKKVRSDDYLMIAAMLAYTAFAVFAMGLIRNGFGVDIDEGQSREAMDLFSAGSFHFMFAELMFIINSTLLRIACAVMLYRVVLKSDKIIRRTIIGVTTFMAAYSICFFFITLFQCSPVSYFWELMYPELEDTGSCIGNGSMTSDGGGYIVMSSLFAVHSVVCMLTDWTLGAMPYFILRHLQMDLKKKIILVLLLSLVVVVGVAALVRIPLIIHANNIEFWDNAIPVALTAAIEPALGTIALCSAAIMPLFRRGPLRRIDSSENFPDSDNSHPLATKKERTRHDNTRTGLKDEGMQGIVVETSWIVEEGSETSEHTTAFDRSPDSIRITPGPYAV